MSRNVNQIQIFSLLDGTNWFCLPFESPNDVQGIHLYTFKKQGNENITDEEIEGINNRLRGPHKRLNLSKYELVTTKAVKILFSPLKMACVCDPLVDDNSFENANSFVIEKKDGSHFKSEEIEMMDENFLNHKDLDLSLYKIVSIQVDTHSPITYSDYLGQGRSVRVWSKSIQDETDKLLHYLYKEVSQP